MTKPIDQYQQTGWSLDALFPSATDPQVEETIESLETTTAALESLRPTLKEEISPQAFVEMLNLFDTFIEQSHRLGAYGGLWFSEDTQNQEALGFMGRIDQLIAEANNRILFINLWWKGLDEEVAEQRCGGCAEHSCRYDPPVDAPNPLDAHTDCL